jgi:tRNA dimethylallyltransferase
VLSPYNLIVILGPTACGKTRLAAALAHHLKTHIISADSRQVYKRMNIGTGKDYDDYTINHQTVPCHLIDILEPGERYNLHEFMRDFYEIFKQLQEQYITPILCGGTGLYIDSVLRNLNYAAVPNNHDLRKSISHLTHPELLAYFKQMPKTDYFTKADLSTLKRTIRAIEINHYLQNHILEKPTSPEIKPLIIGLDVSKEIRRQRIAQRLQHRLKNGLIEEVEQLLSEGVSHEQLQYYGLEYKFVSQFLLGLMSYEALEELLNNAIQQYAKRQMTYFRKMEKDGQIIHWVDATVDIDEQLKQVIALLNGNN